MLNKKFGLWALSLASLGLVACGGNNPQPSSQQPSSEPAPSASIPSQEGKIGVYFQFKDTEELKLADLPEYVSPFITGNWNGYAQTPDKASEMVRLEETDIFYAYIPADGDLGDLGYQITLGYNEASGVSSDKQGIDWNFKTTYSKENFPGLEHPVMTKINDNLYECKAGEESGLGFDSVLPEPVMVKNPMVTFSLDLPVGAIIGENLEVVIKGGFNGWTPEAVEADEDGIYTVSLGEEVIVGKIEMCIGFRNKFVGGMDDKYNLILADMPAGEERDAIGGVEEEVTSETGLLEKYQVTNIGVALNALYGDDYEYVVGPLTFPEHANGTLDPYALPSNEAPMIGHNVAIVLHNTSETEPARLPHVAGTLNNWQHKPMTAVTPGFWQFDAEVSEHYLGTSFEFKFTDGAWERSEVSLDGQNNIKVILKDDLNVFWVEADLSTFGASDTSNKLTGEVDEEVTMSYAEDLEIRFFQDGEVEPEKVCIAGNIVGWGTPHLELEKKVNDAGTYYSAVVSKEVFLENEFDCGMAFEFKITDGTWDKSIGVGAGNAIVKLGYQANRLEIHGDAVGFQGDLEFDTVVVPANPTEIA